MYNHQIRYLAPLDVFDASEAAPVSQTEFYPVHRLLALMRSARKRALNAGSLAAKVWGLDDNEIQDTKDSLREMGGTVSYEPEAEQEEE